MAEKLQHYAIRGYFIWHALRKELKRIAFITYPKLFHWTAWMTSHSDDGLGLMRKIYLILTQFKSHSPGRGISPTNTNQMESETFSKLAKWSVSGDQGRGKRKEIKKEKLNFLIFFSVRWKICRFLVLKKKTIGVKTIKQKNKQICDILYYKNLSLLYNVYRLYSN